MQKGKALRPSLLAVLVVIFFGYQCSGQMTPPPVPMYATNTGGFIQNGPNGANNLVLFTVPLPMEPEPGGDLPDPPLVPEELDFTVIGDLSTGIDGNGDGVDDSLGNFAGMDWSTGIPGSGTLIGSTLFDDDANGEIYRILPESGDTELIGKAPEGLVTEAGPLGGSSGTGYTVTAPFSVPTTGGSGEGLTLVITAVGGGGAITDVEIGNCGSGYQVNDLVTVQAGNFNGSVRITEVIEETGFADLAYNQADGRMYGVLNHYEDVGGEIEFRPNTLWRDTDGDLIPDQKVGFPLLFPEFEVLQTLVGGIAFDPNGRLFIYDNVEEEVRANIAGFLSTLDSNAFGLDFGDTSTGLTPLGDEIGSGLSIVNGDDLIIGSCTLSNETLINTFYIPPINPLGGPDPEPAIYPMAQFAQTFFQTNLFANVRIGDLVGAQTDFDDAPQTFPDNVIIINGIPGKNAVLEALAVSDDFRFCVLPEVPPKGERPLTLELVYTLPNPQDITALGVEIELHSNVPNLGQFFRAYNINTQQYDVLDFNDMLPFGMDETIVVDLSFLGFENYVDPVNGTFKIRIDTISLGIVPFYPWQMKYDAILAVYSFD